MDSINQQQPEPNRENLQAEEAIEKIQAIVRKSQTCFFCTVVASNSFPQARPMTVLEVDNQGHLWFLSADDSHKNLELKADHAVTLFFQGSKHADFLQLNGKATLSRDQSKIDELWEPVFKTWFTGGKDDPRITVIEVIPTDGYYWDNRHGNAIAGVKMLIGAMLGKTLDDSIEGHLTV